ncbi:MAG: pantetheine-phosphate adenylyltransferase [Candidatus Omnitrophota bacterium]|nr:pantetheine-phosphate adenylyltransferase [Candidatus Omnitrophota bacterium]
MKKARIAVYPGTFDPVTYGHIDIIKRASRIFDKVIVAVARNPGKEILFTADERVRMLKDSIAGIKNVAVDSFEGLIVDYVKKRGANVVVRGLRMLSDFEYEFQMALTNRKLAEGVETIFMMTHESYSYISSKLIKEAVGLGADLGCFVPKKAEAFLRKRLKEKKG